MTNDRTRPLLLDLSEQSQRGYHVCQNVLGVLKMSFIGGDPAMDLPSDCSVTSAVSLSSYVRIYGRALSEIRNAELSEILL